MTVTLSDGTKRSFPTLDDYVAWYVAQGHVDDKKDLTENKVHLIPEIFYDWVRRGQVSCYFAVRLAANAASTFNVAKDSVGWDPFVFPHGLENPNLAERINAILIETCTISEGVLLIFPGIETAEDLVCLINKLCEDELWSWTRIPWEGDEKFCLVGLRWLLPSGKSVNHVLGFSSLPSMPITRRAPFTALVLRVRDKKRTQAKQRENDRTPVHLADMKSPFEIKNTHDVIWRLTEEYKSKIIEPEMVPTARARITFSLPLELMEHLCQPENPEIREV
ncbi:hypothetical protein MYX82_03450 [Acidobacteria bacterium AH-259-D05]|nr:hypothetical protein [Acidobacteria bacterium AH-259-D05]